MRSLSCNSMNERRVQRIQPRRVGRSHAGILALPGAIAFAPDAAKWRECGNG